MELVLPDLSKRPHRLTAERTIAVAAQVLYRAWTDGFDRWFAVPGSVQATAIEGAPFFFETEADGEFQPHYGRFLRLERGRLVILTWVTSATLGVETVITIKLEPRANGTHLRLSHAGFPDAATLRRHEDAWPLMLAQLEGRISAR
jgi:uncharacterized protein YndB with AHSA1/START domain